MTAGLALAAERVGRREVEVVVALLEGGNDTQDQPGRVSGVGGGGEAERGFAISGGQRRVAARGEGGTGGMRGDWHGGGGGVDRGAGVGSAARPLGGALADVTLAWLGRAGGVSRGRVLVLRG